MRKTAVMTVLLGGLVVGGPAYADYIKNVKKGNEAFAQKDYMKALEEYHAAETDLPVSPEIDYNVGGALFEQGKYEEAVEKFTRALNSTNPALAEQAHYNLGNTHYRMQDYVKAIQSYEEALKLNPKDMDAKYNLELARKMLKENSKPDQKGQQNQQNKQDQQKQQSDQDKQDQGKDKQDQQNADQNDKNQDQQDKQQQQKADPKNAKQMSKEDAERVLNALRDNEQDTQKRLKRQIKAGEYNGKDW
ncbi:MAG: tetratricopeptide repeat protein [candidate division Zixibacteria bacterium]|nr:tetratricopeptide repeat protein [candidate division Zixibacteria bacterium]